MLAVGAGVTSAALTLVALVVLRRAAVPVARNYRKRRLRLVLGPAASAAVVTTLVLFSPFAGANRDAPSARLIAFALASAIVALAGLYDDRRPGRGRGLRGHFGELTRARLTPGIVKLIAIVVAAVVVVVAGQTSFARAVVGVPVVAGSANLWNLLDVRPGRSLKWFLVVAVALAPLAPDTARLVLGAAIGAAVVAVPLDLGEHAMLGDTGSNMLGFLVGIALFETLPAWGLGPALLVILALHYVAETTTLSRVIERTPVLRWFDALGRRPHAERPFARAAVDR